MTTVAPSVQIQTCDIEESTITWIGLGLAVVFIVVGSFIVKREKFKRQFWSGRPGPLVPFDLLDPYSNRFGYAAAFGVTGTRSISLLFSRFSYIYGSKLSNRIAQNVYPPYVNQCFTLIAAFGVAVLYFPFFVCLKHKNQLFFSASGIIFSIVWGILRLITQIKAFKCYHSMAALKKIEAFGILVEIASQICIFVLLCIYFLSSIHWLKDFIQGTRSKNEIEHSLKWRKTHIYQYVKDLLYKRKNSDKYGKNEFMAWLSKRIYWSKKGFKYTSRIVCTFTVSAFCVFVLGMAATSLIFTVFDVLLPQILDSPDVQGTLGNFTTVAKKYVHVLRVSSYMSVAVTTFLTCLSFIHMMALYRKHIMLLRKGDRTWMPENVQKMEISRAALVVAGVKFSGYQVAYVCWGYVIVLLTMIIALFIIGSQILLPIIDWQRSPLIDVFIKYWPTLLFSVVVLNFQKVVVHFFFLLDKSYSFSIDNRNAFNIASYFLFFFNIILGLLSCFMRIIYSMVLGVAFIARLQKCLLPRQFETLDPGYHSYIGFILLEHAHTNPVAHAFTHLLIENHHESKSDDDDIYPQTFSSIQSLHRSEVIHTSSASTSWLKARNRWQVAKTLIFNPSLRTLRKNYSNELIDDPSFTSRVDESSQLIIA